MRWLRKWWQTYKLARWATKVLAESDMASVQAKAILQALAERKPICRTCLKPYDLHARPFGEWFQVRSILMIPDREPDPMLCDSCFEAVVTTFNPHATNVGTSNSGPTNLVLQKLH